MSQQQHSSSTINTFFLPANPTQKQIDDFCNKSGVQVETVNQARVVTVPNLSAKRAISSPPEENTKEKSKRSIPLKPGVSTSSPTKSASQDMSSPLQKNETDMTINELYNLLVEKLDSSYDKLKKEVNILRNLFTQTNKEMNEIKLQNKAQSHEIETLQRGANSKSLVIFNLPEKINETPHQTETEVRNLLQDLQLTGIEMDEAYRLGRPKQGTTRPVKLKLL